MPFQTADEILEKKYTPKNTTEKLDHKKTVETPLFDKYVKDRKGQVGANFTAKIKKSAGVILTSISTSDDHLVTDRGEILEYEAKTARYALADPITPETIDEIQSMKNEEKEMGVAEAVGEIQGDHRESIDISIEYQTAGALFNKVMDGDGKILFELNYEGFIVEFKDDKPLKESIEEAKRHIKKKTGQQKIQIEGLCDPDFMDWIFEKAKIEKLFDTKQAKEVVSKEGDYLEVHGVQFTEYVSEYEDMEGNTKEFLQSKECVFIPLNSRVIKCRYSRASDTEAAGSKPKLYFGAVEKLPKGRGWEVRSESRPLVYNSNPAATPKGKVV